MADFTWKISGPAGLGIMSPGLIFSKTFSRNGYFVFDYSEAPSLIQGGRNTYQCRVSSEEIFSQNKPVHILVCLNKESVEVNGPEVVEEGVVIYDNGKIKDKVEKGFGIPLSEIAKETAVKELAANMVALGCSIFLLGYDLKILESVIKETFSSKGKEIADSNVDACRKGHEFAKENFKGNFPFRLEKIGGKKKYLPTGNEALGAGAIAAGLKFYSGYPMTPTSSLLGYLMKKQKDFNFVAKQAHDEISVINTAIGAAFAGARSMVGTAGGGFALMSEAYGLAAMTETPLVIVLGQRPGPATGLPTWSSQADLRFAMHAHQDEFPRIVITPGDVEECYGTVQEAHNIADKYQTPVIVMTDKYLADSHKSVEAFPKDAKIDRGLVIEKPDGNYLRYKITETGISPRVLPGTKGAIVVANSDEHGESGQSTELSETRKEMFEKRMRKLDSLKKEIPKPKVYGDKASDFAIVGFGSVKGPVLEAMKTLDKLGVSVRFVHFAYVLPFVEPDLEGCSKILSVENNYTGQFAGVLKERTGISVSDSLLKYDGRPFYPEEIVEKVRDMA